MYIILNKKNKTNELHFDDDENPLWEENFNNQLFDKNIKVSKI